MKKNVGGQCTQRVHSLCRENRRLHSRAVQKEVSELSHYENENERNWTNREDTVVQLRLERQNGSKIVQ